MYYFCTECYQVYNRIIEDVIPFNMGGRLKGRSCPKIGCQGVVVEIDELISPAIAAFNKAGYITEHSCSGHIYDENPMPYITFNGCYTFPKDFLPSHWVFDMNKNVLRARPCKEGATIEEKMDYINMVCKELCKFASKLEN